MKANRIPVTERLKKKISKLEYRHDLNHIKSPYKGNPYWCCAHCRIHDPELSIRQGKHFYKCPLQGLDKEILYYKNLLVEAQAAIKNNSALDSSKPMDIITGVDERNK